MENFYKFPKNETDREQSFKKKSLKKKFSPCNWLCSPVSSVKWVKPESASKISAEETEKWKQFTQIQKEIITKLYFFQIRFFLSSVDTWHITHCHALSQTPVPHFNRGKRKSWPRYLWIKHRAEEEWQNKGRIDRTCKINYNSIAGDLLCYFSSESLKYFL